MIKPSLLQAVMAGTFFPSGSLGEFITVIPNPTKTRYPWGDISDIAGKRLKVIDHSTCGDGDCLCICEKGLVDVNHEDIVKK